jgi:hypothetical protein
MQQSNLPSRERSNDGTSEIANTPIGAEMTPTGMGSEAAEGTHGMGIHAQGQRSSLDDRETGPSFRAGAERSGSEPLSGHTWLHESGYGGRGGSPRTSSDYREDSERRGSEDQPDRSESTAGNTNERVDARRSAFYEWLDSAALRALVDRSGKLSAGEQLILIKGLVPGLVRQMGLEPFRAFLAEIETKAYRFQEAVEHPGDGRASRTIPGEMLGGPTPTGHQHLASARDPARRGGREAERVTETELWARTEHPRMTDADG